MPRKKYSVMLDETERAMLTKITNTGNAAAREIKHANILLATDDGLTPKLTVSAVADKCNASMSAVQTIKRLTQSEGLKRH
jgi:hypothetical protein